MKKIIMIWFCMMVNSSYAINKDDTTVLRDMAYGSHPSQKMDVYLPEKSRVDGAGIILMVHGGGWHLGDKAMDRVVDNKIKFWRGKGVIFISMNYRMLPESDPLEQASDVAQALSYVQGHAQQWGANPAKLILMGHSAGAHLVSLVSANPLRYGQVKPWLATVSLDSATYDVATRMRQPHQALFDKAFGSNPLYWEQASPSTHLSSNAPAMLLVCSLKRSALACGETLSFAQAGQKLGVHMEVLKENLTHRQINELLGTPLDYTYKVDKFISSWMEQGKRP